MFSLLGIGAVGTAATESTPAGAAGVPKDGLTAENAAPSCWSIKQSYPSSADGIYWLRTPKLIAPEQFYCDQTTEGGGWVLIGRGREGWSFPYWGQGSPSTLRDTITGPAAFAPNSLPTPTVDGLLNGARMDSLGTDGVRLRRATNQAGTSWQEARLRIKTYGSWSWAFGGGIYLSSVRFDATSTNLNTSNYRTNTTANVQVANDARRVFTYPWANHDNRAGFSFGSSVNNGTNNATSHLWEFQNENSAIPFTQVFVRPRVTEADLVAAGVSVAGDSGLPASTVRAMLDRRPTAQPWGVTGITGGGAIPSLNAHVTAFAEIGNAIYVGGRFQRVQHGPGGPTFNQPYLAAFNRSTGEWIPTFNPAINAPVWEIKAAPDGSKLFVGGEFTSVNGQANTTALAALDPSTGAPVANWVGYVSRPSGSYDVRAMDIQGPWLYIGGNFTRASGGTGTQFLGPVTLTRLSRLRLTDGRPDGTWKPAVDTAPQDLDASAQGDRVYAVGLFQTLNNVALNPTRLAIMDTVTGAAVPGLQPFKPNATTSEWQNAILEVGDKVFQGGSQHILHQYNRSNYAFERSHFTREGGDFQAIESRDGIVYASCHCNNWQYQDANSWTDPVGYSQVNQINFIGAYDTTDNFAVLPEFHPTALDATGSGGEGPWELFVDSDACLWAGGDLVRQGSGGSFYGGFERFCGRDATAPSTPTNAQVAVAGTDVSLTWNASTDNSGGPIRYEVLKDDETFGTIVTETTFSRSFTDAGVVGAARYFVRAVDAEGNRSATTAVLRVNSPPPAADTLLAQGATWSYRADGQDLGSAWRQPGYDTSSWASGPAQLGWGGKGEVTAIPSGAVTQYFVRQLNVANPSQHQTLTVRLRRDDGAAVYVNGIEVVRDNLPAGPLSSGTPASSFTSGNAENTWFEHRIPASLLVGGSNTIAVELHQADLNNADAIFDLELIGHAGTETNAPSTPVPAASNLTPTSLTISWPAATDDTTVIGYLVGRNGALATFTTATSYPDAGLSPATTYTYDVRAVDSSGNVSAANPLPVTTPAEPPPDPVLFSDGFAGAAGAPWGPDWVTSASGGSATLQSGAGQLAVNDTANAYSRSVLSGLAARTNSDTVFSYQFNSATAVGYFSVFARGSGGWQNGYRPNNGYGLELVSNSGAVQVKRNVNGTVTTLSSVAGARQVSTAKQWVRLRVDGQTIQFRTWVDGQPEPAGWNATLTDAGVSAPGQLHFSLVRGGANVGAKHVLIDDVRITDTSAPTPPDTTPPSAPGVLSASAQGPSQVSLSWGAATDGVGVTGYRVVRDGVVIPGLVVQGLSYTDTGLAASTSYTYAVRAVDAAGNEGPSSNTVTVTTAAEPPPDPVLFSDGFSGVDGGPWGPAWTTSLSGGSATLASGTGQLATNDTANAYSRSVLSGLAARTNSDTVFSYQFNSATAVAYFSVWARGSGGWQNGYRPNNGYGLEFASNSATVGVKRNVGGTLTNVSLASGARQVSTAKQWVRLRVDGQTIQFRTWVDGQPEPSTWNATLTDAGLSAPGQLHFSLVRGGANTGLKDVRIDDLRITDTT